MILSNPLSNLSVLFTLLLSPIGAYAHGDHGDTIQLTAHPKKLPQSLSDFTATYFDGAITTSDDKSHRRAIVLLGGCSSEKGNEYVAEGPFPGYYCMEFSDEALVFFPGTQEFSSIPSMPGARTRHTAVAMDGKLYVIGGRDSADALISNVIVFDPETQKWSTYITLDSQHETSDHGSVARDGKIYVFGGWTADYEAKTTVFSIDTNDEGKITDLEPMPTERGDISAVHYNHGKVNHAFVLGGFTHMNDYCSPLATVERYSYKENSWTTSATITDMGHERGDKAAAVVNEKIVIIGGEDKHEDYCDANVDLDPLQHSIGVDKVEVFNPRKEKDGWKFHSDLPETRFRAAAALDEKENVLYFFGGQKSHDMTCNCYKTSNDIYHYEGGVRGGLSGTAIGLIVAASVIVVFGLGFIIMRRRKRGGGVQMSTDTFNDA